MHSRHDRVVLHDPVTKRWLRFQRPLQAMEARRKAEVLPLLRRVEEAVEREKRFAVGFISYEAAPAFDPALRVAMDKGFPLAWFRLFDKPEIISAPEGVSEAAVLDWQFPLGLAEYATAVCRIKGYIRSGDTYQVNYTFRLNSAGLGAPAELFATMVKAQGAHYAAFIETDRFCICSASPELFFRLDGDALVCRPMKGTAPRGLWPAQDGERVDQVLRSEKNKAENIMIVDMVRNDMGRIAEPGSVNAANLFAAEKYPTLWQMTSTVTCRTRQPVSGILRALFPPASVTGAPKVRTMQIIAELERQPRRIYTGTIGFIAPGRQAQFSVAIRTVLVDKRARKGEYGVGGGIVWDSVPEQEYEECRTKAKILTTPIPEFELLETILWTPAAGFSLLEAHLRRLAGSAQQFSFSLNLGRVRARLDALAGSLPRLPHRVRLRLRANGGISLRPLPLTPFPQPYRVTLAKTPVSSRDLFLYHKTTHRDAYEQALARRRDSEDVLLWNERQELTESTTANLVVELEGHLLTPPLECGLLPGVYRQTLLEQQQVREETVRIEDLARCARIYLANSVRGLWEVQWDGLPLDQPVGNHLSDRSSGRRGASACQAPPLTKS